MIRSITSAPSRQVEIGTRVRWDGDMSNPEKNGEVIGREGFYMHVRWDDGSVSRSLPVALLTGPRWHFEDEWQAQRAAAIAEMQRRYAEILAKRAAG